MRGITVPVSAKEIEEKYNNSQLNDFIEYFFNLQMDYWQYVVIKNEFIKFYRKKCSSNKTFAIINTVCNESRKIEVENFQKQIQKDIQSFSLNLEKIEYLNNKLMGIKKEWEKIVPQIHKTLDTITTYYPIGVDGSPKEPIIYYKLIAIYLKDQISKFKNDDLIEKTPIINNLRASLGNFTFEEWTKKTEKEAPNNINEKLTYYVSIKSDIQRWEDNNQSGKKVNFFEVSRYTTFDDKGNPYGPMSNLLRYINWCDTQINIIERLLLQNNNFHKKEKMITSFIYIHLQNQLSNITDVLNSLKKSGMVDNSTSLSDFRKIFSGTNELNPVIWTGNKSELAYFIKLIHNDLKKVKSVKKEIWNITNKCFIKPDGNSFNSKELKDAKIPATAETIKFIVSNF